MRRQLSSGIEIDIRLGRVIVLVRGRRQGAHLVYCHLVLVEDVYGKVLVCVHSRISLQWYSLLGLVGDGGGVVDQRALVSSSFDTDQFL